jgi:hypothetical protein
MAAAAGNGPLALHILSYISRQCVRSIGYDAPVKRICNSLGMSRYKSPKHSNGEARFMSSSPHHREPSRDLSPCWSGTIWSPYIQHTKNTNKSPPTAPEVNSDITIVFPAPELVCSNIYMVGVPCFFAEILRVQARTSCRRKKPSAPMTPLGWRKITRPQPPLPAPPPASPLRKYRWERPRGVGDVEFVKWAERRPSFHRRCVVVAHRRRRDAQ